MSASDPRPRSSGELTVGKEGVLTPPSSPPPAPWRVGCPGRSACLDRYPIINHASFWQRVEGKTHGWNDGSVTWIDGRSDRTDESVTRTDGRTDRRTSRSSGGTDGRVGHVDGWMDGRVGHMDGRMDGQIGHVDGRMDPSYTWMDGRVGRMDGRVEHTDGRTVDRRTFERTDGRADGRWIGRIDILTDGRRTDE